MATILRFSESDTESDIDACADQKKLKHKVVNCFHEELPVRCALGRVLFVRAEVLHSVRQVTHSQPLLKIRSETLDKPIHTYMKFVSYWMQAARNTFNQRASQFPESGNSDAILVGVFRLVCLHTF